MDGQQEVCVCLYERHMQQEKKMHRERVEIVTADHGAGRSALLGLKLLTYCPFWG